MDGLALESAKRCNIATHISTHPQADCREIFWRMVETPPHDQCFPLDVRHGMAYDGAKIVYCVKRPVFPDNQDHYAFEAELKLKVRGNERPARCKVHWQLVGAAVVDLSAACTPWLTDRDTRGLQILDIVLRQRNSHPMLCSKFVPGPRSFYQVPTSADGAHVGGASLGGGKEVWSGYYSASHVLSGMTPMLNIDVSSTAFFKHVNATQFMCEVLEAKLGRRGQSKYNFANLGPQASLSPQEIVTLEKEIKGLFVHTTHTDAKRLEKVCKVGQKAGLEETFEQKNRETGEVRKVSVVEYFEERYNIRLRFPALPMLYTGSMQGKHNVLPMEVCMIAHGQQCGKQKKLNETQTANMIKLVTFPAPMRKQKIQEMVAKAGFDDDPYSKRFGVGVEKTMVGVEGRVIRPPMMGYAGGRTVVPREGTWVQRQEQFLKGGQIDAWAIISFVPRNRQAAIQGFCGMLYSMGRQLGTDFKEEWPQVVSYVTNEEEFAMAFKQALYGSQQMKGLLEHYGLKNDVDGFSHILVVVLLEEKNGSRYAAVKRVGDVELGVVTQCVIAKNALEPKPQTVQNILFKVNAKMAGVNNRLVLNGPDQGYARLFVDTPTLVLGVDVTHPGPFDKKMPSVAAIVGNCDLLPAKFWAAVKIQKEKREHVIHLKDVASQMIRRFYAVTKQRPARIVIYRDGVSEGQFLKVLQEELGSVKNACVSLDKTYRPAITYVVVLKRHHTRFFPTGKGCGRGDNVFPGTVVDTTVVHPTAFDFYLCSHYGIQGTSCPIHYHVLYDDSGLSSDEIQGMTYALTHMYCRCTRAVSIPAPVYYADLVCTRARAHLAQLVSDASSDGLSSKGGKGPDEKTSSIPEQDLQRAVKVHDYVAERMYFV